MTHSSSAPAITASPAPPIVSLLPPRIQRDLELAKHGLEIIPLTADALSVLPDGDFLSLSFADDAAFIAALERHAPDDGAAYREFHGLLEEVANVVRSVALTTPPNLLGGWPDLLKAATRGWSVRNLSRPARRLLVNLFTTSAGDLLDSWFKGDAIKGLFGYLAAVGNYPGWG